MAEQVAAVTVQVDSSQAIQSMSELRGQIQSANDRLLQMINQFGEGSAEAAQAATEVQRLRGQIEAANRLTQAMDPAAPFNAVMGVLGGIAGGIAAVQGAMALFGSESKEVEQVLLKVNAAMALASGINAVTQSIESFSTLAATLQRIPIINTIITATQRMWNQAVAANPIMTMVAAITLAVAAIGALAYWFIKSNLSLPAFFTSSFFCFNSSLEASTTSCCALISSLPASAAFKFANLFLLISTVFKAAAAAASA